MKVEGVRGRLAGQHGGDVYVDNEAEV